MAQSLGDFVATISASGVEAFSKTIGAVGAQFKALEPIAQSVGGVASSAFSKIGGAATAVGNSIIGIGGYIRKSFATADLTGYRVAADKMTSSFSTMAGMVGGGLRSSFVGATAAIFAFATAGIAGTVEGYRLSFAFGQMSRAIAGLFIPVMNSAISVMNEVRNYIHSLSQEQRDSILKWAGLVGGIALFNSGIGRIPGMILLVTQGFKLLSESTEKVKWLAFAAGIGLVVTGISPLSGLLLAGTAAVTIFGDTGVSAFDAIGSAIDKVIDRLVAMKAPIVILASVTAGLLAAAGMVPMALAAAAVAVGSGVALDALEDWRKGGGSAKGKGGTGGDGDTKLMAGGFEGIADSYKRIAQITAGQENPIHIAKNQLVAAQEAVKQLELLVNLIPGLRVKLPVPQMAGA